MEKCSRDCDTCEFNKTMCIVGLELRKDLKLAESWNSYLHTLVKLMVTKGYSIVKGEHE